MVRRRKDTNAVSKRGACECGVAHDRVATRPASGARRTKARIKPAAEAGSVTRPGRYARGPRPPGCTVRRRHRSNRTASGDQCCGDCSQSRIVSMYRADTSTSERKGERMLELAVSDCFVPCSYGSAAAAAARLPNPDRRGRRSIPPSCLVGPAPPPGRTRPSACTFASFARRGDARMFTLEGREAAARLEERHGRFPTGVNWTRKLLDRYRVEVQRQGLESVERAARALPLHRLRDQPFHLSIVSSTSEGAHEWDRSASPSSA